MTAFDINKAADEAVKQLVGELPTQADDLAYVAAMIYQVLSADQKAALQADPRFAAISNVWAAVAVIRGNAASEISQLGNQ